MASQENRSKYLCFLLRHRPEAAKLVLDKDGWCSLALLFSNTDFTSAELEDIVRTDEKSRYSFDAPKTSIRANQGHSTDNVQLRFETGVPPEVLYHGTTTALALLINEQGLKPMGRHYVHLSADLETAQSVAGRRKRGVAVFSVNAKQMLDDGQTFFISTNGVWLVPAVAPTYLTKVVV
jgi:putative RNA 2'-phosphotransferase